MLRVLARCSARAIAALLLLTAACGGEAPAPAPAAPAQPPAVVVIPAVTAAPEPSVVATAAPEPVAIATAAPTSAPSSPDPSPPEPMRFDRWKPSGSWPSGSYAPIVQPGNITALNAARVPFATYLNGMHNRIHPLFMEFLDSLGKHPAGNSLANPDLSVHLEIVLQKDTGKMVRMGVTKSSGVTMFDVAALSVVERASPFGKAPDAIVSPDGKVYIHWEFHRDPIDACTTRNARPYMLSHKP